MTWLAISVKMSKLTLPHLSNPIPGVVTQRRRNILHTGQSTKKTRHQLYIKHFYGTLNNRSFSWIWIDDSHEGSQWELSLSCLGADNGPSKCRPPLTLACKSWPATNGLHLEGSELTTKSLWTTKTVKSSSAAPTFFCFWSSGSGVGGVGGVIKGVGSWRLLFRSNSDLGQMSSKMECMYVCVSSARFSESARV